MWAIKALLTAFGLMIGAMLIAVAISAIVFAVSRSQSIAVAIITISPLVGIGAAVGYLKDVEAKRNAAKGNTIKK